MKVTRWLIALVVSLLKTHGFFFVLQLFWAILATHHCLLVSVPTTPFLMHKATTRQWKVCKHKRNRAEIIHPIQQNWQVSYIQFILHVASFEMICALLEHFRVPQVSYQHWLALSIVLRKHPMLSRLVYRGTSKWLGGWVFLPQPP